MKVGRLFLLFAALLFRLPAEGRAPAGTTSPPASATDAPAARSESAPPRRPKIHSFVGEVVEILAAEKKLTARETLRDGSPKTTTFALTNDTTVSRGKDSCTFSDIRVNDHVTIKYSDEPGGARRALTVRVTPSAAPKPKPGP